MGGFPASQIQQKTEDEDIRYDGVRFWLPSIIEFDKQITFVKVEHAVRQFCHNNTVDLNFMPSLMRLLAYRQTFILEDIWNTIVDDKKDDFLLEINSVQHDQMDLFYHHYVQNYPYKLHIGLSQLKLQPKMTLLTNIETKQLKQLNAIGSFLIKQGKVAVVFMCAGSSSRFGKTDKFLYPLDLDNNVTLLDLMFIRLHNNASGNYDIPIIINCSVKNYNTIDQFLRIKNYFGFNSSKIKLFKSSALAMFDQQGHYCFDQELNFMKRSGGTAISAEHISMCHQISSFLNDEGVQYICFSGVQNMLQNPCDPIFVGMMFSQKKDIGGKCVQNNFIGQKMPRYFSIKTMDHKVQFLNNQSVFRERLPVALNSLILRKTFIDQIMNDYKENLFLASKYDLILKEETIYNCATKSKNERLCYSFQKDIRYFMSCSDEPLLLKIDRQSNFAPIITLDNEYSLKEAFLFFEERLKKQIYEYQNISISP